MCLRHTTLWRWCVLALLCRMARIVARLPPRCNACDPHVQPLQSLVLPLLALFGGGEYSRQFLESWVTLTYDTVDPRNADHVAKTQSSHA